MIPYPLINQDRKHPLSSTWRSMWARCYYPSHNSYKNYGGRGITVAEEWADFEVFLRDVGGKPSPRDQLDRIDNNQGYGPLNCRWVSNVQNKFSKRPRNGVKYKGLSFDKRRSAWNVNIKVYDRQLYLGYYKSEEEAAIAYNEAALKYFGEFAYLNKIDTEDP